MDKITFLYAMVMLQYRMFFSIDSKHFGTFLVSKLPLFFGLCFFFFLFRCLLFEVEREIKENAVTWLRNIVGNKIFL